MAKYRVLKRFRDTHTKDIHEVNQEIELTEERAAEVEKNLDSSFLELLPEKKAVEVEPEVEPKEAAESKKKKNKRGS